MSITKTTRNHVYAYEPQEGDVAVVSYIGSMRIIEAISHYDEAVREGVAIADHMEHGVHVVPVNTDEMLRFAGYANPDDFVASLTPEEREQLRRECIATLHEAILTSKDMDLVRQASALLAKFVHGAQ